MKSKMTAVLTALLLTTGVAQAKITVFAAASMTNALQDVATEYKKTNPQEEIVFSFASSSTLAKQIEQGAPADLFISANTKWMNYLSEKGLTVKDTEKVLVGNSLVLIAPTDSKEMKVDIAQGQWINNLKNNYLSVGDPDHVPAGIYAKEALTKLNLWDFVSDKLAKAKDVRAALALVERAEAPYGIVYGTDAKATEKVKVVGEFPTDSYKAVEYPAAILKDHDNAENRTFLTYLESPEVKKVFEKYGFSVK
ncbi:molybdate transport system substrate-binding protein [Cricetibacter osteomyelitidis]|uniref:Molybdate transport system substrate-binding protein n=1 Tax=Cricetibacter osteomyelitidis TaxID=1521931 RepID=A0A4R2SWQ7_9PAST|nr:molybdate ABC transporter substrate-binding protein [Cricetibacter osteomyelitidis]TCP93321.1 molybdate transport system substrate-binding protein [Cricetibacter osteomyelitidis]